MSQRVMCYECLLGMTYYVKYLTGADVCALSKIDEQKLIPIACSGASERDFLNPTFQKYLLRCTANTDPAYSYRPTHIYHGTNHSFTFFKDYHIAQHLQIKLKFKPAIQILVSLFFATPAHLEEKNIARVVEGVERFKNAFIYVDKKIYSMPAECKMGFDDMIGQSSEIVSIFDSIHNIAKTDANVLIVGETGTGKELIARALHRHSLRKNEGFISVDCGAIPATLLESELFGFEKGTFTGAEGRKHGLLEFAHNGTLFLDEISELDVTLQSKLLRVLQERQFRRIGGNKLISVDMRVISAMNVNPQKAVAQGKLRKDLFYRLNVIPIHVPPLRQRKEDIPILVHYLLNKWSKKNHSPAKHVSEEVMELFLKYQWSGNIRQLQNIIERLCVLSPGPVIDIEDLPAYIRYASNDGAELSFDNSLKEARRKCIEKFERRYLRKVLKKSKNNVEEAAQIASVSYRTIYRMIERYG